MTSPPPAKLAYLTQPAEGAFLLNLQFDADQPRVIDITQGGARFERVALSREQLRNIVADGTMALLGGGK